MALATCAHPNPQKLSMLCYVKKKNRGMINSKILRQRGEIILNYTSGPIIHNCSYKQGGWKVREGKNGDVMTEREAEVTQGRGMG